MCESKLEGVDEMTKRENLRRKEERKEEARAEIGESQMVREIYRITVLRRQDRSALSVEVE